MKVKNLFVTTVGRDNNEKVAIVKRSSIVRRAIKLVLDDDDVYNEYQCVFTKTYCWKKSENVMPLASFLDIDEASPNIYNKELKSFYKKKEQEIKKALVKSNRNEIGFK